MDESERSYLKKKSNDSHNTVYQNVIHYKERENAFMKKIIISVVSFLLSWL